jgi:hypothetical protein
VATQNGKPRCRLSGTDGNVFAIIGQVTRTLKAVDLQEQSDEFVTRALQQNSYEAILALAAEYVTVE